MTAPFVEEHGLQEIEAPASIALAKNAKRSKRGSKAIDDPILKLDNVILSPHALCWTDQCFAGNGAADVKAVLDIQRGREPRGIVNKDVVKHPDWQRRLADFAKRFGAQ